MGEGGAAADHAGGEFDPVEVLAAPCPQLPHDADEIVHGLHVPSGQHSAAEAGLARMRLAMKLDVQVMIPPCCGAAGLSDSCELRQPGDFWGGHVDGCRCCGVNAQPRADVA